jgi:hypothetical protein
VTNPCADRTNDPQDWFIRADGKQYPFDDLLTQAERRGISRSVLPIGGETHAEHQIRVERALNAAVNNRKRIALARRRRAQSLCWSDCSMREACFATQMGQRSAHGTWGGYLEEEWDEIRREQARRNRRRVSI